MIYHEHKDTRYPDLCFKIHLIAEMNQNLLWLISNFPLTNFRHGIGKVRDEAGHSCYTRKFVKKEMLKKEENMSKVHRYLNSSYRQHLGNTSGIAVKHRWASDLQ